MKRTVLTKDNYNEWLKCYLHVSGSPFSSREDLEGFDKKEVLETYEGMTPQEAHEEDYSRCR